MKHKSGKKNRIYNLKKLLFYLAFLFIFYSNPAQDSKKGYVFEKTYEVKTTSVKNQSQTGTCWSYATVSFIETEMLRMGKDSSDLSEAFFIYFNYLMKAEKYIRMQANITFGCGGQAHDVMNVLKLYGALPESSYSGLNTGEILPDHSDLDDIIRAAVNAIAKKDGIHKPNWKNAIEGILKAYLGQLPDNIWYSNKQYSPKKFAADIIAVNPDDYIEITSYSHHPFYEKFVLEIPDNWSYQEYYNLPLDEMMMIIDNALKNGYSVCWDGDVSENEFNHKKNIAVLPLLEWKSRTKEQKESLFEMPEKEIIVNQPLRQQSFDNHATTDDHLMHIVGIAKDEKNNVYYYTKNSWGEKSNNAGGYLYMSEAYVRLKTIAIMVHKNAIPIEIRKKMKI